MAASEMSSCPFCGSAFVSVEKEIEDTEEPRCFVLCQRCNATGPKVYGVVHDDMELSESVAVFSWNNRATRLQKLRSLAQLNAASG